MKKYLSYLFLAFALFGLAGCDNVQNGYVGVKVDRYGDNRGVQAEALGPGRYYVGFNTDIYEFPTFLQTAVWSKAATEGKPGDDSISFQTTEGMVVNADFGLNYVIKPENVAKVFQKYRRGVDEISDTYLRIMLRDSLVSKASKMTVDELMINKDKFMNEVEAEVIAAAAVSGITIEKISVIGEFRWPAQILAAINNKMTATQDAMKVENELRKTKAQAEKDIAQAEAQVRVAKAEAEAIALRGQALDRNPGVLKQQWIEKWNGSLPSTITGSGTDLILNVNK